MAAGSLLSAATAVAAPRASWAEVPAGGSFSKCVKEDGKTGKATNCVSTSNVKDVDLYSPPWTYEVSSDEAFARLKGAIAADSSLEVVESDKENRYLRVEAATPLFQGKDAVEFLLRGDEDKFVTFKSYGMEAGAITDAKSLYPDIAARAITEHAIAKNSIPHKLTRVGRSPSSRRLGS